MGEASKEEYAKVRAAWEYCDVLKLYSEKLTTAKGIFELEFRNDSNGYYGGWLAYVGKADPEAKFVEITEDWQVTQ